MRPETLEQQCLTCSLPPVCTAIPTNPTTSTDPSRLATVGRLCKRFIDVGRAIFLVERGYDVVLCKYVPEDVTRENTALLARPAGAGAAAQ